MNFCFVQPNVINQVTNTADYWEYYHDQNPRRRAISLNFMVFSNMDDTSYQNN